MSRKTYSLLEMVAYHEASHAVAAAWLRLPLGKTTIVPDGDATGYTEMPHKPSVRIDKFRKYVEDCIVARFAGLAGQRTFMREVNGRDIEDASQDEADVRALSEKFYVPEERFNYLRQRAQKLFQRKNVQFATWSIADLLLDKKTISAREVRQIVNAWREKQAQSSRETGVAAMKSVCPSDVWLYPTGRGA
jgi:ATP-dependent Zn protease